MNDESTRKRRKTHSAGEKATACVNRTGSAGGKPWPGRGLVVAPGPPRFFKIMISIGVGQQGGNAKSVLRGGMYRIICAINLKIGR